MEFWRPHSTGDPPQRRSLLILGGDDGAGHGIRGYPDPVAESAHRDNPQPLMRKAIGEILDPRMNEGNEDDTIYEADGEWSS